MSTRNYLDGPATKLVVDRPALPEDILPTATPTEAASPTPINATGQPTQSATAAPPLGNPIAMEIAVLLLALIIGAATYLVTLKK